MASKGNTFKEVATYYVYLRLAQWFGTECADMKENTVTEFNRLNNFNREKSVALLFLFCTASPNRKRMFDMFTFRALSKTPWMQEVTLPMESNTPLILDQTHSIRWLLFSTELRDGGLYAEHPSIVTMELSPFVPKRNRRDFIAFTIEIEKVIADLMFIRKPKVPELITFKPDVFEYYLKEHSSWAIYSTEPYPHNVIPKDFLLTEKSNWALDPKHYTPDM